jgi:hypothetical protein
VTSDAAVKARTGKDWANWFRLLDRAGAVKMKHADIAQHLVDEHGLPGWWAQNVAVEYERARGLRERHETATGYSVAVTKTMATSLSALYSATANAAARRKWFPKGALEVSSQTKNKYFRGAWKKTARLEVGFYPKGDGKAQIALQVRKLGKKADVEAERGSWKQALTRLQALLQK